MELDGEDIDVLAVLRDFNTSDLTYLRLATGDVELVVSRLDTLPDQEVGGFESEAAPRPTAVAPAATSAPAERPSAVAEAPTVVADSPPASPVDGGDPGLTPISSPVVGIYYRAPAPGEDPYVSEGEEVTPGTTVGLVEAMKVFTAVAAGASGTIEEILVANGDFVEVGQPLMTVRRTTT